MNPVHYNCQFQTGRPFPLKGRYMANFVIHFELDGVAENRVLTNSKHAQVEDRNVGDMVDEWEIPEENNGIALHSEDDKEWGDDYDYDSGSFPAHYHAIAGDLDSLTEIAHERIDELHVLDINGWGPLHEVSLLVCLLALQNI